MNDNISHTELDSHANMVVVGNDCLVVDWINGKPCDALPFDPSIERPHPYRWWMLL